MLVASCLATALITTMLLAIWFLDQNVQRLRVSEISNVRSDMALSQDTNADDTAGQAAASDHSRQCLRDMRLRGGEHGALL